MDTRLIDLARAYFPNGTDSEIEKVARKLQEVLDLHRIYGDEMFPK